MAIIISNHDAPLPLPGGVTLRPGVPTNVERWGIIKNHAVVRSWINAGVLESDEQPDDPKSSVVQTSIPVGGDNPPPEDEALAKLKAEAKELGISVHYRWSAEKIQEEIDKKLAE